MRHTRHIGLRLVRALAGSLLVGSLLLLSPTAAFAGEGKGAASEQRHEGEAPGHQDDHTPPAAERVQETPASEQATPLRQEPPSETAPSSPTSQRDRSLPEPASPTAQAATSADRSPGATAGAVLETTPAKAAANRELPAALNEPVDPIPLGEVSAAASDPIEVVAQAVPSTSFTSRPASSTGGLALDPLVPASLGLLLLARALRRQPSADDRTYSL